MHTFLLFKLKVQGGRLEGMAKIDQDFKIGEGGGATPSKYSCFATPV
jgi:hypothetical protein